MVYSSNESRTGECTGNALEPIHYLMHSIRNGQINDKLSFRQCVECILKSSAEQKNDMQHVDVRRPLLQGVKPSTLLPNIEMQNLKNMPMHSMKMKV